MHNKLTRYKAIGIDELPTDKRVFAGEILSIEDYRYVTQLKVKNLDGIIVEIKLPLGWRDEELAEVGRILAALEDDDDVRFVTYRKVNFEKLYEVVVNSEQRLTAIVVLPSFGVTANYLNIRKFSNKIQVDHYEEVDFEHESVKYHPERNKFTKFLKVKVSGNEDQLTNTARFFSNENYFKDFIITMRR